MFSIRFEFRVHFEFSRAVAPPLETIINDKVQRWLEHGIIGPSSSAYSNALVCAKKKVSQTNQYNK